MSDRKPETTVYTLTKERDGTIICSPLVHKTMPTALTRLNSFLKSALFSKREIIELPPQFVDYNNPEKFLNQLVTAGVLTKKDGVSASIESDGKTLRLTGYEMTAQPISALTAGPEVQTIQPAAPDKGYKPYRPKM